MAEQRILDPHILVRVQVPQHIGRCAGHIANKRVEAVLRLVFRFPVQLGYSTIDDQTRTHTFSVPPAALTGFQGGVSTNSLNLQSVHDNSAHYSVGSEFSLTVGYDSFLSQQCVPDGLVSTADVAMSSDVPDCAVQGGGIGMEPETPNLDLSLRLADDTLDPNNLQVGDLIPIEATIRNVGSADMTEPVVLRLRVPDGLEPQTARLNGGEPLDFIDLGVWGDLFGGVFAQILELISGKQLLLTTDGEDAVLLDLTYDEAIPGYATQTLTFDLAVKPQFAGIFTIEGTSSINSQIPETATNNFARQALTIMSEETTVFDVSLVLQVIAPASFLENDECMSRINARVRSTPNSDTTDNIIQDAYDGRVYLNARYANTDWYRISGYYDSATNTRKMFKLGTEDVYAWVNGTVILAQDGDAAPCNQDREQIIVNDGIGTPIGITDAANLLVIDSFIPTATATPAGSTATPAGPTATPDPNATPEPQTLAEKLLVLERDYGVLLRYEGDFWIDVEEQEVTNLLEGVQLIAEALELLGVDGATPQDRFKSVFITSQQGGNDLTITFLRLPPSDQTPPGNTLYTYYYDRVQFNCWMNDAEDNIPETELGYVVVCRGFQASNSWSSSGGIPGYGILTTETVIHELGHVIDARTVVTTNNTNSQSIRNRVTDRPLLDCRANGESIMESRIGAFFRGSEGWGSISQSPTDTSQFQQNPTADIVETTADMFLNWVYRITSTNAQTYFDPRLVVTGGGQDYLCGYMQPNTNEDIIPRVYNYGNNGLIQLSHDSERTQWEDTSWVGFINMDENGEFAAENYQGGTRREHLPGNARYTRIHNALHDILIGN